MRPAMPPEKFDQVATGGTFDIIHKGHMALLARSFAISHNVIIGLTGDAMASARHKSPMNGYAQRRAALEAAIRDKFPGARYSISRLDDDFGPAVLEGDVQALVVSEEMRHKGEALNALRAGLGLPPVSIVVVPMVLAEDGDRISTTRIKGGQICPDGSLR